MLALVFLCHQQEMENMKIAIKNCKRSLNNEFSKGIFKIIGKFKKEEQKWLESINEPKIQNKINNLKQKLEALLVSTLFWQLK